MGRFLISLSAQFPLRRPSYSRFAGDRSSVKLTLLPGN